MLHPVLVQAFSGSELVVRTLCLAAAEGRPI